MKAWFRTQAARFKHWIMGVLVALGLLAGTVVMATAQFTFTMPTNYMPDANGVIAPLPLSDIADVLLYCDGGSTPVWTLGGTPTEAVFDRTIVLGYGSHDCQASVVTANSLESGLSNTVTKVVVPTTAAEAPGLQ